MKDSKNTPMQNIAETLDTALLHSDFPFVNISIVEALLSIARAIDKLAEATEKR